MTRKIPNQVSQTRVCSWDVALIQLFYCYLKAQPLSNLYPTSIAECTNELWPWSSCNGEWCLFSMHVQSRICQQLVLWYQWGWTQLICYPKNVPWKGTDWSSLPQLSRKLEIIIAIVLLSLDITEEYVWVGWFAGPLLCILLENGPVGVQLSRGWIPYGRPAGAVAICCCECICSKQYSYPVVPYCCRTNVLKGTMFSADLIQHFNLNS